MKSAATRIDRDTDRASEPDGAGRLSAREPAASDNQTLQSLYASGALRAELMVGAADDPAEAEADHLASAVMSGSSSSCACAPGAPPCPSCAAKAGAVHRKAKNGAARSGRAGTLSLGTERRLSAAERGFFEPRFNADFSGIRVHDNPQAAASAAHLGARAFSVDDQIAFGAGEYQSHTPEGRTLLAHELAHVALGHSGLRRQEGGMCSPDAPVCEPPAPAPAGESSITDPAVVTHEDGFDPCALDVTTLTNYALLAEYASALRVVRGGRDATGYFDYRNLQRRLIEERDRRVDMGHAWLATMPSALPDPVYQIVDGAAGTFSVQAVSPGLIMGKPERTAAPYMTWDQFQKFLSTHSIEHVSETEYRIRVAPATTGTLSGLSTWPMRGGLRTSPFGLSSTLPLGLGGMRSPVPGAVFGEGANTIDSWAMPFELGFGRTLTRRLATGGTVPLDYPMAFDIDEPLPVGDPNARPARQVARALDPQNRQLLDRITNQRTKGLGIDFRDIERGRNPLPEVSLTDEPSAVFTRRFGEVTELRIVFDEAVALIPDINALGPTALKNQINANMRDIIQNGRTPSGRAVRGALRTGGFELVPGRGIVGVRPSSLRIAGAEGLRGAGVGGGVAVLGSAIFMLADSADHPEWERELAISGALGSSSSALGSTTESLIYSSTMRTIDRSLAETGMTSLTPAFARGAGRLGGGGVGAMFVEGISMGLLEEREHSGAEVGERLGRAGILGAASVWAGAEIGLAAGSVVPGVGNAVGFIVGLAAGAAIYYIGDKLVPGGREDWDRYEAGCSHEPPPSAPTTSTYTGFDSPPFRCFDAATPIAMADGSFVPIGEIVAGDLVATYNERDSVVEVRPVTAVHAAEPAMLIRFTCSGGRTFTVTPLHKLATTHGWRAAGELVAGDELRCLGESSTLATMEVETIELLPPRGLVYDLSVEATHTYFAGGVLAHNKLY